MDVECDLGERCPRCGSALGVDGGYMSANYGWNWQRRVARWRWQWFCKVCDWVGRLAGAEEQGEK
jgi:hypothetical protein